MLAEMKPGICFIVCSVASTQDVAALHPDGGGRALPRLVDASALHALNPHASNLRLFTPSHTFTATCFALPSSSAMM
jgi:hypothetical protein